MKTLLVIFVAVLSVVLHVDAMFRTFTINDKNDQKKEIRKVWNILLFCFCFCTTQNILS